MWFTLLLQAAALSQEDVVEVIEPILLPQIDLPTGVRGGSFTWDNQLAGEILDLEFFGQQGTTPPINAPLLKRWNGSSWQTVVLRRWNGSSWVVNPIKRWNGSSWI